MQDSTQPALSFPLDSLPLSVKPNNAQGAAERSRALKASFSQVSVGCQGRSPTHTNTCVGHCHSALPLAVFHASYLTTSSQQPYDIGLETLLRWSMIGLKFQTQGCLAPSPDLSIPASTPSKDRSKKAIWKKNFLNCSHLPNRNCYESQSTVVYSTNEVLDYIFYHQAANSGAMLPFPSFLTAQGWMSELGYRLSCCNQSQRETCLSYISSSSETVQCLVPRPGHICLTALPSPGYSLIHITRDGSPTNVTFQPEGPGKRGDRTHAPLLFKVTTWKMDTLFLFRIVGPLSTYTYLQRRLGNVFWVPTCPTKNSSRNGLSVSTIVFGIMGYISN